MSDPDVRPDLMTRYTAAELAAMPPVERALAEHLASAAYDPLAAGDCERCGEGPRIAHGLCHDCLRPRPVAVNPNPETKEPPCREPQP